MNLKESFRYQNFLTDVIREAVCSITLDRHRYKVTKTHFRSKVNPDIAEDEVEEISTDEFYPNDTVIGLLGVLLSERQSLSEAIGEAKRSVDFDIDAAIETNKSRQLVSRSIKTMLSAKATTKIEQGKDYKFNFEGNQFPYYYDVEVKSVENFDRKLSSGIMRSLIKEADEVSAKVDAAFVNTEVNFEPRFDVNDSFDDVMERYYDNIGGEINESAE